MSGDGSLYLNERFASRRGVERVGMEIGEARQRIALFLVDCSK